MQDAGELIYDILANYEKGSPAKGTTIAGIPLFLLLLCTFCLAIFIWKGTEAWKRSGGTKKGFVFYILYPVSVPILMCSMFIFGPYLDEWKYQEYASIINTKDYLIIEGTVTVIKNEIAWKDDPPSEILINGKYFPVGTNTSNPLFNINGVHNGDTLKIYYHKKHENIILRCYRVQKTAPPLPPLPNNKATPSAASSATL